MRVPHALKMSDGFQPAVQYLDGSIRLLEFRVYPDGASALARAVEIEETAFRAAESSAEKERL